MPLNAKGKKVLERLQSEYGSDKGKRVFYAMENSGKLKNIRKEDNMAKKRTYKWKKGPKGGYYRYSKGRKVYKG